MSDALPGPWERIFLDGTDASGRRCGWIVDRRVIAAAPCIGCRLRERDPDEAMTRTWEVWENGTRQSDETGCWCDEQAEAGLTPWRETPLGTLLRDAVCPRCGGHGGRDARTVAGRWVGCGACGGTGWKDGAPPWAGDEGHG